MSHLEQPSVETEVETAEMERADRAAFAERLENNLEGLAAKAGERKFHVLGESFDPVTGTRRSAIMEVERVYDPDRPSVRWDVLWGEFDRAKQELGTTRTLELPERGANSVLLPELVHAVAATTNGRYNSPKIIGEARFNEIARPDQAGIVSRIKNKWNARPTRPKPKNAPSVGD